MKIAVYSGSFNPLHIGHLAILRYLTEVGEFDQVYLIVSPQNPFKGKENNLTGRKRYLDAVEAVKRHPELKVKVDDIELGMEPPHYTIRTLDALKKREPENEFTLVIGADNLESLSGWKEYKRLLNEYGAVVYPREGFDIEALKNQLGDDAHHIRRIDAPTVDVSSTKIREAEARGLDVSDLLM